MKPLTKWAWIVGIVLAYVGITMLDSRHPAARSADNKESKMVTVRVFNKQGKLTGPMQMPRIELSEDEWKKRLTPEQYKITRGAGTEAAFCGGLLKNKEAGAYVCVDCGLPLFTSDAKFESGTGWPSFFQPIAKENIEEITDNSYGMVRTEIRCERCGAHLGHVFPDGPKPTGLRYCLNSEALKFYANPDLAKAGEDVPTTQPTTRPAK